MGIFTGKSAKTKNLLTTVSVACMSGKVPLLWGPPGVGKTAFVRTLAQMFDLPLYILIPSTMDPSDVDGLPAVKEVVLPNGDVATVTENTLQHWAQELIVNKRGILFIDEASTATPAVQASLLSVLQGRRVGRHTLPEEIWMIAAANSSKDAADGWELAAPMANRFLHLDFPFVTKDWLDGMVTAFGKDDLSEGEANERAKIVAFLSSAVGTGFINNKPEDATEAGLAWPSPRSWDNLAETLGRLSGSEFEDSANTSVRDLLVKGFVGDKAANEFILWHDSLSLPEYDRFIKDPTSVKWAELNASEILIILSQVIKRIDEDSALASLKVFSAIAGSGKHVDVCTGRAYDLIDAIKDVGTGQDMELLKELGKTFQTYLPELAKAGILPSV